MKNKYIVFDIETDGFLDEVTKMHCFCYAFMNENLQITQRGTITTVRRVIEFIKENKNLGWVCHNLIKYDIPVLEKLSGTLIDIPYKIDTLGLSWYLYPNKKSHGLDPWGERIGIKKPEIENWTNLSQEEYIHRCKEDVSINAELFRRFYLYLQDIYKDQPSNLIGLINYIGFKMDCLREQEEEKCYLDLNKVNKHKEDLEKIIEDKINTLKSSMPKDIKYKTVKCPGSKIFKKDGNLSVAGEKWFTYLTDLGLPMNHTDDIEVIDKILEPNPNSSAQMKDWLYSLGWKPLEYKESFSKVTYKTKKVPQITLPFGAGLCPSVKKLFSIEPNLEALDKLSVASHRLTVMNGYLNKVNENSEVVASAQGFTNTLRLKHSSPIANLPKPDKWYGYEVRDCIAIRDKEKYIMCGSDVSGLEDATGDHYIFFYDPKYVQEKRTPGFDPHTDIAKLAELMTVEEEKFFQDISNRRDELKDKFEFSSDQEKKEFKRLKGERSNGKTTNFAAKYGAGGKKIAETLDRDIDFGKKLHKIYWNRNWAIKQVSKDALTKSVRGQTWVYNPVAKFWYFLKHQKDIFSTLNQGTGSFVFDFWLYNVRKEFKKHNIKVQIQYHDEMLFKCLKTEVDLVDKILKESIQKVNKLLKLNVTIEVSVEFGYSYATVH